MDQRVKIRAYSPGRYPIIIFESSGNLMAAYHETGYDPQRTKPVSEDWLRDNAIGRHSFVAVEPPEELPSNSLADYARRGLLGDEQV